MTPTPTETAIAAFIAIKARVCGEKIPHWKDVETSTRSRMDIADICDHSITALRAPVAVAKPNTEIRHHHICKSCYPPHKDSDCDCGAYSASPPPAAGGMKDAKDWSQEWRFPTKENMTDWSTNEHSALIGFIKHIQADAFAAGLEQADALATQPEALLPEGIHTTEDRETMEVLFKQPESVGDARELATKIAELIASWYFVEEMQAAKYEKSGVPMGSVEDYAKTHRDLDGWGLESLPDLLQAFASSIRAETLEEAEKCKIEQDHIVHLNPNRRLKDVTEYNDGYTDGILSLRKAIRSLKPTGTP